MLCMGGSNPKFVPSIASIFLLLSTPLVVLCSHSQICSFVSAVDNPAIRKIELSISTNVHDNLNGDPIVFCNSEKSSSCYALFTSTAASIQIISAGCLAKNTSTPNGIGGSCEKENCTALASHLVEEQDPLILDEEVGSVAAGERKTKTGYCCCSSRLCNERITKPPLVKPKPVLVYQLNAIEEPSEKEKNERGYLLVTLAILSTVSAAALLMFLLMKRHYANKLLNPFHRCNSYESRRVVEGVVKMSKESDEQKVIIELGAIGDGTYLDKDGNPKVVAPSTKASNNVVDNSNVKLLKLIGQGRYGIVWHALLLDVEQEVAVKLYKSEHKLYFNNEMHIYQIPLMKHPNIVSFIAGSWRLNEDSGVNEYMLVMDYIPNGSLMIFLKNNSFNFASLCKLAHSAANGLAYLHTEVFEDGLRKPAIVHRDFNSRNILVKRDGTCAVSDLGFAQKVSGADLYGYTASLIPDVGTLRYMPPEVLEGSVDLNKCESALKQIDVYALALVLWEISSRCDELYLGYPSQRSPEFKLPFEAELGHSLKFDEMRNLVSVQQRRPKFPTNWNEGNEALRCLMETIEDSWDQDSEARLTSACVVSRLANLSNLWSQSTNGELHVDELSPNQDVTTPTTAYALSPSDVEHHYNTEVSSLLLDENENVNGFETQNLSEIEISEALSPHAFSVA